MKIKKNILRHAIRLALFEDVGHRMATSYGIYDRPGPVDAAGEDFDFHAHFGFSAPTSEEQQEVQEQGQGQDSDLLHLTCRHINNKLLIHH